jgi:hypothetical protein
LSFVAIADTQRGVATASSRPAIHLQEASMHKLNRDFDDTVSPTYAARSFAHDIPKYRLPA